MSKALGLGANSDDLFTELEYDVVMDLAQILQPVQLAVELLYKRDSNLITAETTLRFVIRKLKPLNLSLTLKLVISSRKRIEQSGELTRLWLYYTYMISITKIELNLCAMKHLNYLQRM